MRAVAGAGETAGGRVGDEAGERSGAVAEDRAGAGAEAGVLVVQLAMVES